MNIPSSPQILSSITVQADVENKTGYITHTTEAGIKRYQVNIPRSLQADLKNASDWEQAAQRVAVILFKKGCFQEGFTHIAINQQGLTARKIDEVASRMITHEDTSGTMRNTRDDYKALISYLRPQEVESSSDEELDNIPINLELLNKTSKFDYAHRIIGRNQKLIDRLLLKKTVKQLPPKRKSRSFFQSESPSLKGYLKDMTSHGSRIMNPFQAPPSLKDID